MRRAGWRGGVIVLAAALTLSGCGGGDEGAAPTATVVATAAAPATTATPESIGAIVWSIAVDPATQAPVDPVTALPNDAPQVIAALPIGTLPAGTTLQAHWTIDGDPLPALDPGLVTVGTGRADAWVAWTLRWSGDQPWPIGRLGIVVEINGAVRAQAELPIVRTGT